MFGEVRVRVRLGLVRLREGWVRFNEVRVRLGLRIV
jgi:hypothetical protein